jgi:hypothetical protein
MNYSLFETARCGPDGYYKWTDSSRRVRGWRVVASFAFDGVRESLRHRLPRLGFSVLCSLSFVLVSVIILCNSVLHYEPCQKRHQNLVASTKVPFLPATHPLPDRQPGKGAQSMGSLGNEKAAIACREKNALTALWGKTSCLPRGSAVAASASIEVKGRPRNRAWGLRLGPPCNEHPSMECNGTEDEPAMPCLAVQNWPQRDAENGSNSKQLTRPAQVVLPISVFWSMLGFREPSFLALGTMYSQCICRPSKPGQGSFMSLLVRGCELLLLLLLLLLSSSICSVRLETPRDTTAHLQADEPVKL